MESREYQYRDPELNSGKFRGAAAVHCPQAGVDEPVRPQGHVHRRGRRGPDDLPRRQARRLERDLERGGLRQQRARAGRQRHGARLGRDVPQRRDLARRGRCARRERVHRGQRRVLRRRSVPAVDAGRQHADQPRAHARRAVARRGGAAAGQLPRVVAVGRRRGRGEARRGRWDGRRVDDLPRRSRRPRARGRRRRSRGCPGRRHHTGAGGRRRPRTDRRAGRSL